MAGRIKSRKQLRQILQEMPTDHVLHLKKAKFWCQDAGYHFDIMVLKWDDNKYRIRRTGYHCAEADFSRALPLEEALRITWNWIKAYKTTQYGIYPH